ncbi:MAG: 16S rRNA methyltransferase [Methylophaga sp.]|nr:MAG: 16S rRNA methyltransferase [Methylophaga sp.]
MSTTSVSTDSVELEITAKDLADKLALPFTSLNSEHIQLVVTQAHIEIRAPDLGKPIFIDFGAGKNAHRRQFGGGRGQPLAKAIGLKKGATPTIIDATAGFGGDAFVLASLGCNITLIEQNPLIATLLNNALERATENAEIEGVITRMSLINDNAIHYLNTLNTEHRPDVIYLDPMYPNREKSALVKKDMRLLHQLAGPDTDSEQLLTIAQKIALKRVVVKRPKSAPFIGEQKPVTRIESKNTRYDVYLTK